MTKRGRNPVLRVQRGLVALDAAAVILCVGLALLIRFQGQVPEAHWMALRYAWPVLLALRLTVAYGAGLYDFRRRLTVADHVFAAVFAALLGIAGSYGVLALVQLYYLPEARLSRWVAVADFALLTTWLGVSRAVALKVLHALGYRVRVLLIGSEDRCRALEGELRAHAPAAICVAGTCVLDEASGGTAEPALDGFGRAGLVDRAVLVEVGLSQTVLSEILAACDRWFPEVYLFPALDLSVFASVRVESLAGIPLIPLCPSFQRSPYRGVKRIMDVAVAGAGLVLLAPVELAAVAWVKLTSPGPVLYTQLRVGRSGRPFTIYKFRTMVEGAERRTGPVLASADDARVTPAGRWLRAWRVDELPQLWNVLRGDMSLVGPRPERPEFVEGFVRENPLYARRSLIRPGLTGLAQIHGRYDSDYLHKLRYDLIYVNSLSLMTDLRILLATIRAVATRHGAQ